MDLLKYVNTSESAMTHTPHTHTHTQNILKKILKIVQINLIISASKGGMFRKPGFIETQKSQTGNTKYKLQKTKINKAKIFVGGSHCKNKNRNKKKVAGNMILTINY